MAPKSSAAKKSVNEANLTHLGAASLSRILIEAAASDAALKRRLRMELAAAVGAPDLALEIDKRLNALGTSRTRVSWRRRPALLQELSLLRDMIADRLAELDARLAFDRIVAWFDLYPGLTARVSDAKGELPLLFDGAVEALAALAERIGPDASLPVLAEALATRLDPWASWVGRAAAGFAPATARRLLAAIVADRPAPTGRLGLVARKLADRGGDLDAWINTLVEADRNRPEIGAEVARRLARAGRAVEARTALDAARPDAAPPKRWGRAAEPADLPEAWLAAEIAVLDAEGRTAEADAARWRGFARTLSPDMLRGLLEGLPDFEDVEALDRAFALAAADASFWKGLAFLMAWPAQREAAAMILDRRADLRGAREEAPLWANRLSARHPVAALLLLRSQALALTALGGDGDEIAHLIAEAETLAATVDDPAIGDHAAFIAEVKAVTAQRRSWR